MQPTSNAPVALFYNLDRFQEAGIAPPPKQWGGKGWDTAALLDAGRKLTRTVGQQQAQPAAANTRARAGGEQAQWFSSLSTWWILAQPWVWGNGGHFLDAAITKVLVDTPEVVSTLQWLADLTWKEHVQPTPDEAKATKPSFTNGMLAGEGTSANLASSFQQQIKSFRWDVGVLPTGTSGVWTRHPSASALIWQGTKQPDAAWNLVEFLGGETAQLVLGLGGQGVPDRMAVALSPTFLKQPNGIDWQLLGTSKLRRDRTPYWQEHGWTRAGT
ncbi:MAG: extracellular solute-binding protein [Chloroflexota bacterium]